LRMGPVKPRLRAAASVIAALGVLSRLTFPVPAAHGAEPGAPVPAGQGGTARAPSAGAAGSMEPEPGADSEAEEAPNSTEQGQTHLTESFERRPIATLLQESRFVGLRDTTFSVLLRSFYDDKDNFNHTESQAWTLGGLAGFRTGYFLDFIRFGASGYTSQRLDAPVDKDGTQLLQPGQKPYTVVGESYVQLRLTDEISALAGRKGLDTPFINTQDSLMTPNTFQAYAVQGVVGSMDEQSLRFGAGYFDKMKPRNSQDFESMATAAGAPAGVTRGVDVAGANFKTGQLSIGAIDYYSPDIINIVYGETKFVIPLANKVRLQFAGQYTRQNSTGDDLLTGKSFSTDQYGFKAEIAIGTVLLTSARTVTAVGTTNSAGSGTNVRSPWGGYPGYTAVQVENFFRAGEDATMLRAAYNFPRATGLSVYGLWVHGSTPQVARQYAQTEYDLNLQWIPRIAALKGLNFRMRYGHVSQEGPANQHENDLRLILNYVLR